MIISLYRSFTCLLLSFVFFSFPYSSLQAAEVPEDREPLRNYVKRQGINRIKLGEQLADLLFDVIDKRELFDFGVGPLDFEGEIRRNVYESIPGTDHWVVVDEFQLKGDVPFLKENWNIGGGAAGIGLNLGLQNQLIFQNIRQVNPKKYHLLSSVREKQKELSDSSLARLIKASHEEESGKRPTTSGLWIKGQSPQLFSLMGTNPVEPETFFPWPWEDNTENKARFGKLLNLLLHPFRIPFHARNVGKLKDGEIVSYMARGSVSFGASVGMAGRSLGHCRRDSGGCLL